MSVYKGKLTKTLSMTREEKKIKIKSLVEDMLKQSHEEMMKKIDKALNSGAVNVDGWDEINSPMILPKCIVTAILQDESTQYDGAGTSFEKQMKKDIRNLRYFL